MNARRYKLPAINTLLAFEAAARLGSITRAAEERATSHSAISRHIRSLESAFEVALFERRGRGVALTKSGETYFLAVQSAMDTIHNAGEWLHNHRTGLTIGCTLEMSGLLLHPIFPKLKRALGDEVAVRIVVYDFDLLSLLIPSGLDIVFEVLESELHGREAVRILQEEVVPVGSPSLLEHFGPVLARHPRDWHGVPRLDIGRRTPGWATWDTWFDAHRCPPPDAPVETFENYFHLLRAAADGDGIALGWNGFVSDYFDTGRLLAVRDTWLPTSQTLFALATPKGEKKTISRTCLFEISRLVGELCSRSPVTSCLGDNPRQRRKRD